MLPQRIPIESLRIRLRRSIRPLHPPPPPVIPILEHILELRIQRPVIPLPISSALSWYLQKTLIKRQIVPNRVLPALFVALEVRKFGGDVSIDLREGGSFQVRRLDGHGDEGHVRVGRLALGAAVARRWLGLRGLTRTRIGSDFFMLFRWHLGAQTAVARRWTDCWN